MPQGSDQVGPLVGIDEDVPYSAADANALVAACRASATLIEGQAGTRAWAVSTAEADFEGCFSRVFADNARVQVADATNLVRALRDVATKVDALTEEAGKEQERRETGRRWKRDHDNKSWAEKTWDAVFHADPVPIGPEARPLPQTVPEPVVGAREAPEPGSTSGQTSGTSSAAPADLRSFATTSQAANDELAGDPAALRGRYETFEATCTWGAVYASGVFKAYDTYLANNVNDVTWASTVAEAFEAVGGAEGVSTVADAAIQASLEAAGVTICRSQIEIDPAMVQGGQITSGYADDPVNTLTGSFVEPEIDLAFTGGAGALALIRVYSSSAREPGAFGPGWASALESRIELDDEAARWVQADGAVVVFPRAGQGWERATGESRWLEREDAAGGERLVVSDNAGGRWVFTASGVLVSSSRGEGTGVAYVRDEGRVVRMEHERGRSIRLVWDGPRVVAAETSDGRRVSYVYDEAGRLTGARAPRGSRGYEWGEAGLIVRVTDADGVVEADNTYDEAGRVRTQRSAFGRTTRYSYLPGRVTQVADADGERSNVWTYDRHGRLIGVVDAHGKRQSAAWDRWGNQVVATDRDGGRTVRVFDERGHMLIERTPTGMRTTSTWDDQDRLTQVRVTVSKDSDECVTRFEYDGTDRHPRRIIDPEGGTTAVEWDRNLLVGITDPTGRRTTMEYDSFGDIVSVTNGAGECARLERDEAGRVTASVSPAGRITRYEYDAGGACVRRIDPDGAVWGYEFSEAGRLRATIDPLGGRVETVHDESGADTETIDQLGRRLTKEIDDLGNTASVSLPDESRWEFTHDALSRLTQVTDASGARWSLEHDAVGHIVAGTDPTGVRRTAAIGTAGFGESLTDGEATWSEKHDPLGRLIAEAGPDGRETTYRYDRCGRVIETVDPDGGVTTFSRDEAGRVLTVTMASGASYSYEYDAAGRWCASVSTGGARFELAYDADGNIVTESWPTGEVVTTERDACGRPVRRVEPGSGVTTLAYDKAGRVVRVRDPYYGARKYAYDAAGQVVAVTNALGGVTRFEYDANARPYRTIDPAGGVTTRSFDGMGRVTSLTDPLGRTSRYFYDGAGRVTRTVDAARVERTFTYDCAGRIATESLGGTLRRSYAFDPAVATMQVDERDGDGGESWQWWWDWRGEMIHARQGSLHTTYEHDADGRVTRMVRPDGEATVYEYDREGRVSAFAQDGIGRVSIERDCLGRAVSALGDGIRITWEWENGFLVRQVVHQEGRATTVTFVRDQDGRILSRAVDGETTFYKYDAGGQLTSVTTPSGEVYTYAWDALGRMTKEDGPGGVRCYQHDAAGQLVRVRAGEEEVSFTYDALGRRTGERGPGGRRCYAWDAEDHLVKVTTLVKRGDRLEAGDEWNLEWGASGDLTRINSTALAWDQASGLPVPISAGEVAVSVAAGVTAAAGAAAEGREESRIASTWLKTDTDPWAGSQPLMGVGEGVSVTSRATLAFDGLEVMGVRVYDPMTSSFLSTDPLLAPPEAAWAGNAYSYAGNNPIGFSDPTGLAPVSDAQLQAYSEAHSGALSQAWNAATSWVKDNWQYVAAAAVVTAGVVMCATGVGAGVGAAILVGAAASGAFSAGSQYLTTGTIDPRKMATDIAIGGATGPIGGGVGSAVGSALGRTALCQAGRNILSGVASGAAEGGVSGGLTYLAGDGPHTVSGLAANTLGGAGTGGLCGGGGAAIANKLNGVTGWACFAADTPVVMGDGSTKAIAEVEVGDLVLAHNPHTGADEAREVLEAPVHEGSETWRVATADGGAVTTTETHRFWVQGQGWTKACDLEPGNRLRGINGEAEGIVAQVGPTGETATVHNLTVHGLTSYYVATSTGTTVLVHNEYTRNALGQFTKEAGGESAATAAGRRIHENYPRAIQAAHPGNWRFNRGLLGSRGDLRPDAVNYDEHLVRELKPDSKSGVYEGKKQIKKYLDYLNGNIEEGEKKWVGEVDYYRND